MSLLSSMKEQISKAGGSKGKIFYVKDGMKSRIRFLVDFEGGYEFTFHDSFAMGVNSLCQEELGKDCPLCEAEGLRTRKLYCWPVWNYDTKEVQLFLFAANNCSPVPALIGLYETYGTLIDRDFVISRQGKQQNTSYTVVPMDKAKFRNSDAKVPTNKAIIKILNAAYPLSDDFAEIDEDGYEPKKNKKGGKRKPKYEEEDEDEDEEEFDEDDEDEDELFYEEMSAQELFKLCKKREISAKPKQKKNYYIDLLEAADNAEYDEDEEDEW